MILLIKVSATRIYTCFLNFKYNYFFNVKITFLKKIDTIWNSFFDSFFSMNS